MKKKSGSDRCRIGAIGGTCETIAWCGHADGGTFAPVISAGNRILYWSKCMELLESLVAARTRSFGTAAAGRGAGMSAVITAGWVAITSGARNWPRPCRQSGLPGWYADPEVAVLEGQYWTYPASSATYGQQVSFDAFSLPDLVHWTKHPRVLDGAAVQSAKKAMWHQPSWPGAASTISFSRPTTSTAARRLTASGWPWPTIRRGLCRGRFAAGLFK